MLIPPPLFSPPPLSNNSFCNLKREHKETELSVFSIRLSLSHQIPIQSSSSEISSTMTAEMKPEEAALAAEEAVKDVTDEPVKAEAPAAWNEEEKTEQEKTASPERPATVLKSSSFKEESNFLSDLKESERRALAELRAKVEKAILENKLFKKDASDEEPKTKQKDEGAREEGAGEAATSKPDEATEQKAKEATSNEEKETASGEASEEEVKDATAEVSEAKEASVSTVDKEVSLWGVPLLPSKGFESTNVILLKFLRARDFKVEAAFEMLQSVLRWRKETNIDCVLDEDYLSDGGLANACYMDGVDREGHPVCYNVSGVFQDEQLYQKAFGSEEARERFLRWRVQVMEKGIQRLDFRPGGVASLLQVTDLKNSPGLSKKELRTTMKQAVQLLQDNYPEFVARNVFINVPFWYYAVSALLSPFLTQRTKSKFVFVRPSKVAETLLKYIPAEAVPIRYGGLKRDDDIEFSVEGGGDDGGVSELLVKAGSTETIELPVPQAGSTLVWDLTVLGWEVNYKEEFLPADKGSYTIIVQKGKKMGSQEEPVRNSFTSNEPGKVVLTIENGSYRKKKVLYRYKVKSS